jgi:hypothetical protein
MCCMLKWILRLQRMGTVEYFHSNKYFFTRHSNVKIFKLKVVYEDKTSTAYLCVQLNSEKHLALLFLIFSQGFLEWPLQSKIIRAESVWSHRDLLIYNPIRSGLSDDQTSRWMNHSIYNLKVREVLRKE